jgi:hypothetical protein
MVPAALRTATGCEVLRASKPQSIDGLEPRIRYSEVQAASTTLWICRCAWTTLARRPQLHRAIISKLLINETEKELWLGRRTSEATGARLVVRQRSTSREHSLMRQYGFLSRLPRYIDKGEP